MARISFEEFQEVSQKENNYNGGNSPQFFSLRNDGDEAVVRIMHDSPNDFDIIGVHSVKVGDRFRKVGCVRSTNQPVDVCPLCKAGTQFQYRFYVHMLQYFNDENGNVVCKPVIWDRAAKSMSRELMDKLNEYGPLSDVIFKIKRSGAHGDMKTTYSINFANPSVYRPDLYKKDEEAFKDYTAFGTVVMDKSAEEINQFMQTGEFPKRESNKDVNIQVEPKPTYNTPVNRQVESTPEGYGYSTVNNNPTPNRPSRYY